MFKTNGSSRHLCVKVARAARCPAAVDCCREVKSQTVIFFTRVIAVSGVESFSTSITMNKTFHKVYVKASDKLKRSPLLLAVGVGTDKKMRKEISFMLSRK
jgi:hypothetical protein